MDDTVIITVASVAVFAIAAAALVLALRRRRRPSPLPDGAIRVPLRAAFGSKKGMGMAGGSSNSLNPLLLLHDDHIEYRVLQQTSVPYKDITEVDAVTGWGRAAVVLSFADTSFLFTGNTGGKNALTDVVRRLRDKGCPLSDRARSLVNAPG